MNDRFAAQLRQHLLDTADERPAHDQLAAVVEGVAGTAQRRAFMARLSWSPGSATRYGLVAVALIGVLAAAWLVGGGTGPMPSPTPTATSDSTLATTPEPTASPEPPAATVDPATCTQFDSEGVYTARAGTLPVGLAVPASASSPWSGLPDEFLLTNAPCGGTGSVRFSAALVAHLYADACHWKDSSIEAPTVPDLVAKLLTQAGHETSDATETHVGAFRATRLDLSIPADFVPTVCDEGVLGLWETSAGMRTMRPGTTVQVYVAEVDGVTLVLTAAYLTTDATPDILAEIDSIVASLRVDM